MYQPLLEAARFNREVHVFPLVRHISAGMRRNLTAVQNYYQNATVRLNMQHPLIRLLDSMPPVARITHREQYDILNDMAMELATGVSITNAINTGKVWPGAFFGSGCMDILIATRWMDLEYSESGYVADWRALKPLRCVRSPKSDLSFMPAFGIDSSSEDGLSVIYLDVAMLGLQHRCWKKEQERLPEGERGNIHQFLTQYPILNMLESQLNCQMFNRLVQGNVPVKMDVKPPIALPSYRNKVAAVFDRVHESFQGHAVKLDNLLDTVPLFEGTLRSALPIDDGVHSRAVEWAYLAAWSPYMHYILSVLLKDKGKNTDIQRKVKRELRNLHTDRSISKVPNDYTELLIDSELMAIEMLVYG